MSAPTPDRADNGDGLDLDAIEEDFKYLSAYESAIRDTGLALVAEVRALRGLLVLAAEFADDEDCWFDHHGGCQTHGFLTIAPGERCPAWTLRDAVSRWT